MHRSFNCQLSFPKVQKVSAQPKSVPNSKKSLINKLQVLQRRCTVLMTRIPTQTTLMSQECWRLVIELDYLAMSSNVIGAIFLYRHLLPGHHCCYSNEDLKPDSTPTSAHKPSCCLQPNNFTIGLSVQPSDFRIRNPSSLMVTAYQTEDAESVPSCVLPSVTTGMTGCER